MRPDDGFVCPRTLLSEANDLPFPLELPDHGLHRIDAGSQQPESGVVEIDVVFQKRLEMVVQLYLTTSFPQGCAEHQRPAFLPHDAPNLH